MRVLLLLLCLIGLNGCASLSLYSVSEATMEDYLRQAVEGVDGGRLGEGSSLALEIDSTDLTVGPDGRNVIRLDVTGQATVDAFASRLPADVTLSLEGTPYFDGAERAIYLRQLRLLDGRIEAPWLPVDLAPLTRLATRLVSQTLETVPLYRLEDASWGQRLLARGVRLRARPGRLVLEPGP